MKSLIEKADNLEYFGSKLIQARHFAEMAHKPAADQDFLDNVEYFARKAYRLGSQVIDYLVEPQQIMINIHRLGGDESGVEVSTLEAFDGRYQSAKGANKREAAADLAEKLGVPVSRFSVHFSEVR